MRTKLVLLLAATILIATPTRAQSGPQYQGSSQAAPQFTPGPGSSATAPDPGSGVNPTPDLDDCYSFPQVEIPTDSALPGPADPGPAYVYATNDSPNADVISIYAGSSPSSPQAVGSSGAQISLAQVARELRQKSQQPTQTFQQIIQDNQGRLEACNAGGSSCRVI